MLIKGDLFIDEYGRKVLFRGVNLGGSSKVPFTPDGATYRNAGFFDHRTVSFVGRPFPLAEADEHFSRLREWGFTFLRFLITWEAIEHAGPGIYDIDYLDYIEEIIRCAGKHGFTLFIDPHQDVWSRFTGGDGAPGWTLEAAGLDITRFTKNGAAVVHNQVGDPLPKMIWPTNATKLACSTMFTLFFGGNDFAPLIKCDGIPIQDYLQEHYIQAVAQVAKRLSGMPFVIGYDTFNEPSCGYIGIQDLNKHPSLAKWGNAPTPFQGMVLGDGQPVEVGVWKLGITGIHKHGKRLMNVERERAWEDDKKCVWRQHGVWDYNQAGDAVLLHPEYFGKREEKEVDFAQDYLKPFILRFTKTIRSIQPDAFIFIEGDPQGEMPTWDLEQPGNLVNATHWYDDITLVLKKHIPFFTWDIESRKPIFGRKQVIRTFSNQMQKIKALSREKLNNVPSIIGEFGIPFDLDHKKAYKTGNFQNQIEALDTSFRALENSLLHSTLWNYTSDNTNARGDQWNDEDLSIFSRDQQTDSDDINSGARAAQAFIRPYARYISGDLLRNDFDYRSGRFLCEFVDDPDITIPSEIFVPRYQYPFGYHVTCI